MNENGKARLALWGFRSDKNLIFGMTKADSRSSFVVGMNENGNRRNL